MLSHEELWTLEVRDDEILVNAGGYRKKMSVFYPTASTRRQAPLQDGNIAVSLVLYFPQVSVSVENL